MLEVAEFLSNLSDGELFQVKYLLGRRLSTARGENFISTEARLVEVENEIERRKL